MRLHGNQYQLCNGGRQAEEGQRDDSGGIRDIQRTRNRESETTFIAEIRQ